MEGKIALHGNEDNLKHLLPSDSTRFIPTGLRIVESIVSLFCWNIIEADMKSSFLQTGNVTIDIHVKPPRKSQTKMTHLWVV